MLIRKMLIGLFTGGIIIAGMFVCMRFLHLSLFASGLLAFSAGTLLVWLIARIITSEKR